MGRPTAIGKARQSGFGYLVVLFIAVMLGIASMVTYEQMDTLTKREKEQQWLFAGMQYRQAIASYYRQSPEGMSQLPEKLDELLKDPRFVSTRRHLRKLYPDPLTGQPWQTVLDETGRIVGVVSSSDMPVLQLANVEAQVARPEQDKAGTTYADFRFALDKTQAEKNVTDKSQQGETVQNEKNLFSNNNE